MSHLRARLRIATAQDVAGGGAILVVTLAIGGMVLLGGCSSQRPMTSVKTDKSLPAGWVRYSYGALSIGAPRSWPTYNYVPLCPPTLGTTAIIEFTETEPEAASCAAFRTGATRVVALGCLTGQAIGQFPIGSPSESTVVGGQLLRKSATQVYLKGDGWEATTFLLQGFSPQSLGQEILATVKPTGRSCR